VILRERYARGIRLFENRLLTCIYLKGYDVTAGWRITHVSFYLLSTIFLLHAFLPSHKIGVHKMTTAKYEVPHYVIQLHLTTLLLYVMPVSKTPLLATDCKVLLSGLVVGSDAALNIHERALRYNYCCSGTSNTDE